MRFGCYIVTLFTVLGSAMSDDWASFVATSGYTGPSHVLRSYATSWSLAERNFNEFLGSRTFRDDAAHEVESAHRFEMSGGAHHACSSVWDTFADSRSALYKLDGTVSSMRQMFFKSARTDVDNTAGDSIDSLRAAVSAMQLIVTGLAELGERAKAARRSDADSLHGLVREMDATITRSETVLAFHRLQSVVRSIQSRGDFSVASMFRANYWTALGKRNGDHQYPIPALLLSLSTFAALMDEENDVKRRAIEVSRIYRMANDIDTLLSSAQVEVSGQELDVDTPMMYRTRSSWIPVSYPSSWSNKMQTIEAIFAALANEGNFCRDMLMRYVPIQRYHAHVQNIKLLHHLVLELYSERFGQGLALTMVPPRSLESVYASMDVIENFISSVVPGNSNYLEAVKLVKIAIDNIIKQLYIVHNALQVKIIRGEVDAALAGVAYDHERLVSVLRPLLAEFARDLWRIKTTNQKQAEYLTRFRGALALCELHHSLKPSAPWRFDDDQAMTQSITSSASAEVVPVVLVLPVLLVPRFDASADLTDLEMFRSEIRFALQLWETEGREEIVSSMLGYVYDDDASEGLLPSLEAELSLLLAKLATRSFEEDFKGAHGATPRGADKLADLSVILEKYKFISSILRFSGELGQLLSVFWDAVFLKPARTSQEHLVSFVALFPVLVKSIGISSEAFCQRTSAVQSHLRRLMMTPDNKYSAFWKQAGADILAEFCPSVVDVNGMLDLLVTRVEALNPRPADFDIYTDRTLLTVSRTDVLRDTMRMFGGMELSQLQKAVFKIKFKGEHGVDAGGLKRDWYMLVTKEILDPQRHLFEETFVGSNRYKLNPFSAIHNEDPFSFYKFAGQFIAKAIMDRQALPADFTKNFYKWMIHGDGDVLPTVEMADYEDEAPEHYQQLRQTFLMGETPVEILEDMTFTVEHLIGRDYVEFELVEGGETKKVTNENKREYLQALIEYKMMKPVKMQMKAFLEGFYSIIPHSLIRDVFSPFSLSIVIAGQRDIDLEDWLANTRFTDGYSAESQQVVWFWNVLRRMDKPLLAKVLKFATGSSQVPVGGFRFLRQGSDGSQSPFKITRAGISESGLFNDNPLPVAHTCFNQLDLPVYATEDELEKKLLSALEHGSDGIFLII